MTGIEIGLPCGLIAALILLALMIFYIKSKKDLKAIKIKDNQMDLKPKKEMYTLFTKWLVAFLMFFICLVILFCFSMLIVELTK